VGQSVFLNKQLTEELLEGGEVKRGEEAVVG